MPKVDKNRWERVVPLSNRARAALTSLKRGEPGELLFGKHDYRTAFVAGAKAALGEERGKYVTPTTSSTRG